MRRKKEVKLKRYGERCRECGRLMEEGGWIRVKKTMEVEGRGVEGREVMRYMTYIFILVVLGRLIFKYL